MKNAISGVSIVGSSYEEVPGVTVHVKHGDIIQLGTLNITCFYTPCHTKGHMIYYATKGLPENCSPILFTGDTIFIGGCGRFFEGSADDMLSAIDLTSKLPQHTHIYCGHEYSTTNLKFALSVDPLNTILQEKYNYVLRQRSQMQPSVPSTIAQESLYNPFFRAAQGFLKEYDTQDRSSVIKYLRRLKDEFK